MTVGSAFIFVLALWGAPSQGVLPTDSRPASAPAIDGLGTAAADVMHGFMEHVSRGTEYSAEARKFISMQWQQRRNSPDNGRFLPEALAVIYPDFKTALDALAGADSATGIEALTALAAREDPYLAVTAAYIAMERLAEEDRPIDADAIGRSVRQRIADWPRRTSAGAEFCFLSAFCALEALRYDEATELLEAFLRAYPAAPERMRASAAQMTTELSRREPERLGDVTDLMNYARREIGHARTDDDVQKKQREAVALLNKLVDEAEQREKQQSSSSQAGRSGRGGSAQGRPQPSSPAQQSMLPPGKGGEVGTLNSAPRVRPGESWGAMPPKQREEMLQMLQRQFPSQYRELVEQYYRQLSKEDQPP